jgi:hypothetical protein
MSSGGRARLQRFWQTGASRERRAGMARRRSGLNLSAPKVITYLVAVALMAFGIIAYYTELIDVSVDTAFLTLAAGAVLLAIANLLKDL